MQPLVVIFLAIAVTLSAGAFTLAYVRFVRLRRREGKLASSRPSDPGHFRALREAKAEARTARELAALTGTLDVDELLLRVLTGATAVSRADAAAVSLHGEGGPPVVVTHRLAAGEAYPMLAGLGSGDGSVGVIVRCSFVSDGDAGSGSSIRDGLLLPLAGDGDPVGTLGVFWRREADLSGREIGVLEELAAGAARAIANAQRFRHLHELAVRDPLTGLYNRRYFYETLEHEVRRAQRYSRQLALIVFDLDDFKAINERVGHLGGDAVLAGLARLIRSAVRAADIPCRVGGDEFAVVLPESSVEDASRLFERLQGAAGGLPTEDDERLRISAGIAEVRPEDDGKAFFARADGALYEAKRSGKGRMAVANELGLGETGA